MSTVSFSLSKLLKPSSFAKGRLALFALAPTMLYNMAPASLKEQIASAIHSYTPSILSAPQGECCGIIAYIGKKPLATKVCVDGVKVLQFRGYDSCGLATLEDDEFKVTKFAIKETPDCINAMYEQAPKIHKPSCLGIAHTRWATHGAKTEQNAHPHFDAKKRVAVVHNGMLNNFKECREQLVEKYKVELRSQTDTELIAQYIGIFLDEGLPLEAAIQKTIKEKIHGTWALCIISKLEPTKIYLAKNAGTLVVGIHDDFLIASSDIAGFQEYTQKFVNVEDKKLTVFDFEHKDKIFLEQEIKIAPKEKIELDPRSGHKHFLIQEIYEQSDTLDRATNHGGRLTTPEKRPGEVHLGGLKTREERVSHIENLIISACGTSYYASLMASYIFRKLQCVNTIQVIDASEITEEDFKLKNAGFCAVSQSGETADLIDALQIARDHDVTCFSIINKVESRIARDLRCGIYLNAGREVSVASTKAFPAQVMCLTMLAIWFAQHRQRIYEKQHGLDEKSPEVQVKFKVKERIELIKYLGRMPELAQEVIVNSHKICCKIAELMDGHEHLFILGRGPCEAIAKEGALKIKEVSYIHAEGYIAGAFKHGPIAMIDDLTHTRFILLITKEDVNKLEKTLEQVKARNAFTIVITDCLADLNPKAIDIAIEIPSAGWLSPLLCVFPLQLLSYELAVRRGKNPDKPRHLAKEVTVK